MLDDVVEFELHGSEGSEGLPPVAREAPAEERIAPQATAWYRTTDLTFSDAIAAVRREIWHHRDITGMRAHLWSRREVALAHAR